MEGTSAATRIDRTKVQTMERKTVIPHNWDVPDSIRHSVAEVPGTQRALEADGHLFLILHKLPTAHSAKRELRMFWRSPDGTWASDGLGVGINALQRHVTEFNSRLLELEDLDNKAASADDYFHIRCEIAPIHRAAQNMSTAISRAYEACPDDRELLICRNLATTVERTSELLKDDATYGLEYAMAKHAESQALASHRLNLIAAIFFPILAFASIFGMNLDNGFEHQDTWVFWLFVALGIAIGMVMKTIVFRTNPVKGLRQ
jgi:Mg2+ and Co2+ transporter CorA